MVMSSNEQAWNSVRGGYVEMCGKIAYATEVFAQAALHLAKSKGRSERSFYRCSRCSMFHLSSRSPEACYREEAANVVQVGATRIGVSRKVKASGPEIAMAIMFTAKDGTPRTSVYRMTREQARAMLDAFIEAIYDNKDG
jgi:hypothetical protein